MENKHTAGPWKYNDERTCIESLSDWLVEPDKEQDEEGIRTSIISCLGTMGGNAEADIALIEAAPDLLEACQWAKAFGKNGGSHDKIIMEKLNLAIAKATANK